MTVSNLSHGLWFTYDLRLLGVCFGVVFGDGGAVVDHQVPSSTHVKQVLQYDFKFSDCLEVYISGHMIVYIFKAIVHSSRYRLIQKLCTLVSLKWTFEPSLENPYLKKTKIVYHYRIHEF